MSRCDVLRVGPLSPMHRRNITTVAAVVNMPWSCRSGRRSPPGHLRQRSAAPALGRSPYRKRSEDPHRIQQIVRGYGLQPRNDDNLKNEAARIPSARCCW